MWSFKELWKKTASTAAATSQPDMDASSPGKAAESIDFDSDRPIHSADKDRLGFNDIAKKLSASVRSASASEGFVIGVEGAWGSGKSSILNLLCSNIEKNATDATIIRFDPWVVGDRDNMVASLMTDLAAKVLSIQRTQKKTVKSDTEAALSLAKKLRKYGAYGRSISPLAKLASICGVPYADLAAKGLDALAEGTDAKKTPDSLNKQKEDLIKGLRDFNHRFIVVIDDIDRLEPAEAAEIIRLVRAVGDFPNIVYLMCYDRDVLAHSLESAIQVKEGKAFLQKIIQVSFPVPRPEEFDLRRWFLEECNNLYFTVIGRNLTTEAAERLAAVCDTQGQLLQTPRDVGQILNALRLMYPPTANEVDFADLCWLQIIRIKNEDLFKWIEDYLAVYSAVHVERGVSVNDAEKKTLAARLEELMPDEDISLSPRSVWYFGNYIPGISQQSRGEQRIVQVLENVDEKELAEFEENKRLASPHHYRSYFAFAQPSGTLRDAELKRLLDIAGGGKSVVNDLEKFIEIKRPQGGTMYEVALDRIKHLPIKRLSPQTLKTLTAAIGDTVDDAQREEREPGFFGQKWVWRNARAIFEGILAALPQAEREAFLSDTFSHRKSIGWLLGEIIGSELFAHDKANSNSTAYDSPLLTKEELDTAIATVFARLAGPDRARIIQVPSSLTFFYRWIKAGGEENVKRWMSEQSQTDTGFLKLLNKCRSWMASGDKVYHPLNKRDLEAFMDFDHAIKRLKSIAEDTTKPSEERDDAQSLLKDVRLKD